MTTVDHLFSDMSTPAAPAAPGDNPRRPIIASVTSKETSHDAITLAVLANLHRVLKHIQTAFSIDCTAFHHFRVEHELAPDAYVDVAVLDSLNRLIILLEIKSQFEAPLASGWTRQLRRYARIAQVPCVLIVAHDLGEVQKRYLTAAGNLWLDLRTV